MRTRRIAYEPIITVVMSLIEATVAMVGNDHSHFRNNKHLGLRDRKAILLSAQFASKTRRNKYPIKSSGPAHFRTESSLIRLD